MFDELERAAQAGDARAAGSVFADLKERYPRTAFAQQGGLLAAQRAVRPGQADAAKASLAWVADNAVEDEYKTVARLRLAGLLLQAKEYDEALKQLDARQGARASRRWSPTAAATCCWPRARRTRRAAAYQAAWKAMDEKVEYRRLIDAKLTALGARAAGRAGAGQASGAGK